MKNLYSYKEIFSELLENSCLNRLQFAEKIGVGVSTINGYFNDNYFPHIQIAIKIARFFDCSLDYLLGLSDEYGKFKEIDVNLIHANFITNLQKIMNENNTSIAKTMKALNMSESNFYRWKNGEFPKTINLIEIAKYFGVSIDYLVGRED